MAEVTKHGRWVYRDADIHRCGKPTPSESRNVKTGDIWECNRCKKQWVVKVNRDQREGTWFTWTEKPDPSAGSIPWRD